MLNFKTILLEDLDVSPSIKKETIFLRPHPDYPTHFAVGIFNDELKDNFSDILGPNNTVSLFDLEDLSKNADKASVEIVCIEDPSHLFNRFDGLNQELSFDINVDLLPFQLKGFNYLKDLKSDIVNWSTGCGKSVYGVSKAKYLLETENIDYVIIASRNHNKINWSRQFKNIGNLDAVVIDEPGANASQKRKNRAEAYKNNNIFIVNYEKFRTNQHKGDAEDIIDAISGKKVYFIWDEMPMMLKNVNTQTYKGVRLCLKAPVMAFQTMLSATPLENTPEDVYACVKLLEPSIFKNLATFRDDYAKSRNPFNIRDVWSWDQDKLKEMGLKIAHITHQADKYKNPEIRDQFPKESWEDIIIDISSQDKKIYDEVLASVRTNFWGNEDLFSKFLVLQLVCDNPELLNISNAKLAQSIVQKHTLTNKHCTKIVALKELLHSIDGKIVLFNMYNEFGSQFLYNLIQSWKIPSVLYDGNIKQKQLAEDQFRYDDKIKVFVSSDQGSDSINLEMATSCINYNLPWKWTTLIQRVNRINRLSSESSHVSYYNLIVANTIEERKASVLMNKKDLQDAIFGHSIADQSAALDSFSKDKLWYLLTGEG